MPVHSENYGLFYTTTKMYGVYRSQVAIDNRQGNLSISWLQPYGDDAKILSGGQSLISMMRLSLIQIRTSASVDSKEVS